jgi:hypothetical protein
MRETGARQGPMAVAGGEGEGERVTGRRWGTDMRARPAQCWAVWFKLIFRIVLAPNNLLMTLIRVFVIHGVTDLFP